MSRASRKAVRYGQVARVDLLPQQQRAELAHERMLPKLLLWIVVSAVLAALIWAAGMVPVMLADQRLAHAETESADVLAEISEYADVQTDLSDLANLESARQQLLSTQVLFAGVRDEVLTRLDGRAELVGFTGALAGSSAAGSAQIDLGTLCVGEAATITLVLSSGTPGEAASATRSLEDLTGFTCLVMTEATDTTVTVQIGLGPDALAERLADETGGEQQ